MDPYDLQVALGLLLAMVSLAVALLSMNNPAALLLANLIGVASFLICPSPP
jgi:hypothetical protein